MVVLKSLVVEEVGRVTGLRYGEAGMGGGALLLPNTLFILSIREQSYNRAAVHGRPPEQ